MSVYRIPLIQGTPHFVQQALLDGRTYTLEFEWNEREAAWYFRIADSEDVIISANHKMVADWPMLNRVITERKPPGEFFVVDTTGRGENPGLDELDERVLFLYLDAEEMEAYRE